MGCVGCAGCAATGAVFRLALPAENLTVEVALESAGQVRGFVQSPAGLRSFTCAFAERVDIDAVLGGPADLPG